MKRYIKSDWDPLAPPKIINKDRLELVDCWEDTGDVYFTVDIGDEYLVDIRYPRLMEKYDRLGAYIPFDKNYSYIINCDETGSEIYNQDMVGRFRNLKPQEINEIINFVDYNAGEYVAGSM